MKRVFALVLTLATALGLAACNSGGGESGENVVRIGIFEPALATMAPAASRSIWHAVCQLHHPEVTIGDKTYKVELSVVDNESSNDKAVSAASQLISQNVSIVLGSYGSGVSIAASDTFGEAGVPAMGVTCTNPRSPR